MKTELETAESECTQYVEDAAICDDTGEPKGQCLNCGAKWDKHPDSALPDELKSTPPHTAADAAAAKVGGYRAGAFLSADAVSVKLIGYGVYVGDEVAPSRGYPNPHIKLDDGKEVWGCECWWGPEDKIKAMVADYEAKGAKIVPIDIDAARKEWATSIA
jgi:hypothetical protein